MFVMYISLFRQNTWILLNERQWRIIFLLTRCNTAIFLAKA